MAAAYESIVQFMSINYKQAAEILSNQIALHPVHLTVELLFGALIVYFMFLVPLRKPNKKSDNLTKEDVRVLLDEFQPVPFETDASKHSNALGERLLIDGYEGAHVLVKTSPSSVVRALNMSTYDFLCLSTNKEVVEAAKATVRAYGCGSCGPRGFYGTIKPHLDLERDLAKFLGTHSAIIYSMGFATTPTLLPCFAAKGDTLFVDDACNILVVGGCNLSRSQVIKYRHNDLAHLEQLIAEFLASEKKLRRRLFRRWIVTEGLFRNRGDLCHLPELVALCTKHKFRLLLDDSYGFGVLGSTGRGTPEHYGVSMDDIDIYISSLATALGSVGGFCAGTNEVVDHQRIVATGYVFSASSPPFVAAAASKALELLEKDPEMTRTLQSNAKSFRAIMSTPGRLPESIKLISCVCDVSPICHFVAKSSETSRSRSADDEAKFRRCSDKLLSRHKIVASTAAYNDEEENFFPASLRIVLKRQITKTELTDVALSLSRCLKEEFS